MNIKTVIKALGITFVTGGILVGGAYYVASKIVDSYDGLALPNTNIDGVVVSGKTQDEIEAIINHKINALSNREITVEIDDIVKKLTINELNPEFNSNAEELAKEIIENQKDLTTLEQLKLIINPSDYSHGIAYTVLEENIEEWVNVVAEEVKVLPIEPTIKKQGDTFITTREKTGLSLNKEELKNELLALIEEQTHEPATIKVSREDVESNFKEESLKTINAQISTYSSYFDPNITRATNVINASNKINGVWVMPGEEFSYTEHTLPVTLENGYGYGTIFVNGTTAQGLGGGMCQVSSTLYNTMLEAGVLATERKAHSLRVGYVPLGQDATMTDTGIDLKFINTLDYPIYIESITSNGVLTISFWSNEDALKGIDYEARSTVYNGGYSADTTLYGYKDGELIYEKFLHTSNYKRGY